jgi:hypothetical protein
MPAPPKSWVLSPLCSSASSSGRFSILAKTTDRPQGSPRSNAKIRIRHACLRVSPVPKRSNRGGRESGKGTSSTRTDSVEKASGFQSLGLAFRSGFTKERPNQRIKAAVSAATHIGTSRTRALPRCARKSGTRKSGTDGTYPCLPPRFQASLKTGGESGIRTHVRVSPKHAFQACAFSHSAISPARIGKQLLRDNNPQTAASILWMRGRGRNRSSQPTRSSDQFQILDKRIEDSLRAAEWS